MEYTKLLGIAVGIALLCLFLRGISKEHSTLLTLGFCVFTLGYVISAAKPCIDYMRDLSGTSGFSEQAGVIIRALSVGLITTFACDICRSSGETEIARGAELIGKCALLSLSLPLVKSIINAAGKLLGS